MPPTPRRKQQAVRRQAVFSTQERHQAAFEEHRRKTPADTGRHRDAASADIQAAAWQRAPSPRRRVVVTPGTDLPGARADASSAGPTRTARSPTRRAMLVPFDSPPAHGSPLSTADESGSAVSRRIRSPQRHTTPVRFDAQPSARVPRQGVVDVHSHQNASDASSYHSSDSEEEQQEANWIARCLHEWYEQCRAARAHGISVRSEVSRHVAATAANRRRLSSAMAVARAASQQSLQQLHADTLPSQWDSEYTEAPALDRAMRARHGLADYECETLWKDGIETVAWLEQLRDEDFMEAGIDVVARREQAEAEERAERAWQAKERAQQRADPASLEAKETIYHLQDEFSWHPIDDEQHFSKSGRKLDARRNALRKRDEQLRKARQRGEEKAREARKRIEERDAEKREVEAIIQRGARELKFNRDLRCGKLSEDAIAKIRRSVTSLAQLTSLELSDMRQLGLDAADRHLLDLIRLEAIADGATDPKDAIRQVETRLRQKEAEVAQLESFNHDLRRDKEHLEKQLRDMQQQLYLSASIDELDRLSEGTDSSISVASDVVGYGAGDPSSFRPAMSGGVKNWPPTDTDLDSQQARLEKLRARHRLGRPKQLGFRHADSVEATPISGLETQAGEQDQEFMQNKQVHLGARVPGVGPGTVIPEPEPEPEPEPHAQSTATGSGLSDTSSSTTTTLSDFYVANKLAQFASTFEKLGVEEIADFDDLTDAELTSAGLGTLHIKRLRAGCASVATQPTRVSVPAEPQTTSVAAQPTGMSVPAEPQSGDPGTGTSANEIHIECRAWEDTRNLPPGAPPSHGEPHVRYVIAVDNCGNQYEIRKRWQELYTMSTSISKLDKDLPESLRWRANGGKPLDRKRRSATKPAELDERVIEITNFCAHLSQWLTQLAKSPNGEINFLKASANPQKNLLADFFAQGASYDASRSTIVWSGSGAYPGLQPPQDVVEGLAPHDGNSMSPIPEHGSHR